MRRLADIGRSIVPPVDYLAHPVLDRQLREYLGVSDEEELLDALACDFFYLPSRDLSQNEGHLDYYHGPDLPMNQRERVCPFGIRWSRGAYDSKFAVDSAIEGPFHDGTTAADILKHRWPKTSDFDFSPLLRQCEANSHRVIIGGFWSGILGDSYRMYGFERFLFDMAANPALIHTLVDKLTEVYLDFNDTLFSLLKGKLDVWFFGNDFGHQNGLLFSKPMWTDFFFENLKRLVSLAHGQGLKVMMHSCGAISELIPLLIEAGVDIIDPVQVTATGMNAGELKSAYGEQVVFHGGIDTQHILPCCSADAVKQHTLDTVSTLGRNGGYILAPSQIYQADISPENVLAVYGAAKL